VRLPGDPRISFVPLGPWGFRASANPADLGFAVDAFAAPGSALHPHHLRGHEWRNYRSLDASRYVSRGQDPATRRWRWSLVDVDRGTAEIAPGLVDDDQAVLCVDREGALAWEHPKKTAYGRLVRVDWATGTRRPVTHGEGVPDRLAGVGAVARTPGGTLVLRGGSDGSGFGFLVYDGVRNALSRWTPWRASAYEYVLALDGEDGAFVHSDNRRIERVRWGSTEREVLFPRPRGE
jgi:hypothetical protein